MIQNYKNILPNTQTSWANTNNFQEIQSTTLQAQIMSSYAKTRHKIRNYYFRTIEVRIAYHSNGHKSTRMNIHLDLGIPTGVEFTSLVSSPTLLRLQFQSYNYSKDFRVPF
ncbi:hypothetical protein TorRG33x02_305030 [Trema orientale]|uniref:Uncharacterized protein n=1 Tax=Trema orientale TaxID=63057 RepID=A0A2P5BXH8_TREOI|nr:hypothetical protein TorRG33x02_305030 [Trema orientale]